MQQQTGTNKIFQFSILFLILYLGLILVFSPSKENEPPSAGNVFIKSLDTDYSVGQLVRFEVKNTKEDAFAAEIEIKARKAGEWENLKFTGDEITINPNGKVTLSYSDKNTELFQDIGRYQVVLKSSDGEFLAEDEFEVSKAGIFRSLWQAIFFKPIYNTLIFLIDILASNLGFAIIFLTLIIKFILLIPSKKGIIAQQKMQKLQPELESLKKKYTADPQKQAQEMMALWKRHGVNPGAAILPTLIQFPILIALFFVVKEGLMPHNAYLLYPISILQNFDFVAINFHFLYLDLKIPDPYFALPLATGALQFWQMKSMAAKSKKKQEKEGKKPSEKTPQESVMGMMTYILPALIVVFSATLPSAVGLYWGVSTVFAIVQQFLLQKKNS